MNSRPGRRVRLVVGLWALAEVLVFVLVAGWIGVGWTILAALATTALGWLLLARQGMRAVGDLRDRARLGRQPGQALGDAGLIAVGGLLVVLPGFLGDLVGLLCLLPGTRRVVRAVVSRVVTSRLPDGMRGPVRVHSVRTGQVGEGHGGGFGPRAGAAGGFGPGPRGASRYEPRPRVIEGEIVEGEVVEGDVVHEAPADRRPSR